MIHQPTRRDLLKYAVPAGLIAARKAQAAPLLKWAFVRQSAPAASVVPGTSHAFTVTGGADGNYLVLCVASRTTTVQRTLSSVTQTNAWGVSDLQVNQAFSASPNLRNCTMWAARISGGTSGTTITLTFSGSVAACCINLSEWSGMNPAQSIYAFELGGSGTGTGTAVDTNSVAQGASTYRNSLLMTCVAYNGTGAVSATPTDYTALTQVNDAVTLAIQPAYRIATNQTGNQSPTFTLGSSVAWGSLFQPLVVTDRYGPGNSSMF